MTNKARFDPSEVVDMELHCIACGTRLYMPTSQASAAIAFLKRTGATILICTCVQAQLVNPMEAPQEE